MAKININSTLKTKNNVIKNEFIGIINNNKITYKDNGVLVNIYIDNNKIKMERKTSSYIIKFTFIHNTVTQCEYYIKGLERIIYFDNYTKQLQIKSNKIFVEYDLYQQQNKIESFMFKLIYEVIK